jgi:Fur family ferric uptake transcriptional regulator
MNDTQSVVKPGVVKPGVVKSSTVKSEHSGGALTASNLTEKEPLTPGFAWFWDGLDHYLNQKGLKQTNQRKTIVEHFLRMNTHVDADELYQRVKKEGYEIGLATIYRTLNLLRDAGLAEQQSFQDGRSLFEICAPDQHHDHLVCLECGLIIEFEDHEIEQLQEKIALKYKMKLKNHRLDLYGVCDDTVSCKERSGSVTR